MGAAGMGPVGTVADGVGAAVGVAGVVADGVGVVPPSLSVLLPHLPGALDQAGAGVRVPGGEILIGTPAAARAAGGCLCESGVLTVRSCAQSGAAGDPPEIPAATAGKSVARSGRLMA